MRSTAIQRAIWVRWVLYNLGLGADLLSCSHNALEGPAARCCVVATPHCDAAVEDDLDRAPVEWAHDGGGWGSGSPQLAEKVLKHCWLSLLSGAEGPGEVL